MDGKNIAFIITWEADCPSVISSKVDYGQLTQQAIDELESRSRSYTGIDYIRTEYFDIEEELRRLTQLPRGSVIDDFMIIEMG